MKYSSTSGGIRLIQVVVWTCCLYFIEIISNSLAFLPEHPKLVSSWTNSIFGDVLQLLTSVYL